MKKRFVEYVGIDRFNRPCFKRVGDIVIPEGRQRAPSYYYGSTDVLFDHHATEAEVLAKVEWKDLTFFGNKFGCEPEGGPISKEITIRESTR